MIHTGHESMIVRRSAALVIPLVQLFGLYVLFFGQYGPGGGFVGGVMLAASLIAGILVFGPDGQPAATAKKLLKTDGLGLLIFAGVGGLCLIGGGAFLNYSSMQLPGLDDPTRRYLGIVLTQIGVAADIAVAAVSIVFSLYSASSNEVSDG